MSTKHNRIKGCRAYISIHMLCVNTCFDYFPHTLIDIDDVVIACREADDDEKCFEQI